MSYNNETWHAYNLPKENPKNIWNTWHTPWDLVISAFFHKKLAMFATSRNTDIDCILIRNFKFFFLESLKIVLINMVTILIMPPKLATLRLLEINQF